MALDKELEVYKANVASWTEHNGKFVLIHGQDVVDFYAAYEDAIKAGYQNFKMEPFLVKQVNTVGAIQHITRSILPFSTTTA